jgi:hypothetical protein
MSIDARDFRTALRVLVHALNHLADKPKHWSAMTPREHCKRRGRHENRILLRRCASAAGARSGAKVGQR